MSPAAAAATAALVASWTAATASEVGPAPEEEDPDTTAPAARGRVQDTTDCNEHNYVSKYVSYVSE